jgi:hypothetical protein
MILDKRIDKVIKELVEHIKNEEELDNIDSPKKYYYDRMEWVRINKSSSDDLYQIALENLRVLVYQLSLFNRHILFNKD